MAMSVIQGGPGPNLVAPDVYNFISRTFKIENCRNEFFRDTCKKVCQQNNSSLSSFYQGRRNWGGRRGGCPCFYHLRLFDFDFYVIFVICS